MHTTCTHQNGSLRKESGSAQYVVQTLLYNIYLFVPLLRTRSAKLIVVEEKSAQFRDRQKISEEYVYI